VKDYSFLMIALRVSLTVPVATAVRPRASAVRITLASCATLAPALFDERRKSRKMFPASKLGL
jgi:hypothetical protein